MQKGLVLIVVLVVSNSFFSCVSGQWRATNYISTNKLKFDLSNLSPGKLCQFCFPGLEGSNAIAVDKRMRHLSGYLASALTFADWNKKSDYFYQTLCSSTILGFNFTSASLSMFTFTENVSKFLVVVHGNGNQYKLKEFETIGNGYQQLSSTYLLGWWGQPDSPDEMSQQFDTDSISIVYQPRETGKPSRMFVGQFDINEVSNSDLGLSSSWIHKLIGDTTGGDARVFDQYSEWSLTKLQAFIQRKEKRIPSFENFGLDISFLPVFIDFSSMQRTADEQSLAHNLIMRTAELYPYYKDRELDKSQVFNNLEHFFQNKYPDIKLFWRNLRASIRENFKDPHFEVILPDSFYSPEDRLVSGPIRIKNIAGNNLITAVFGDKGKDSIPIGSEVYSLDGRLTSTLRDEEVEKILLKKITDTLRLGYRLPGLSNVIWTASIPYNLRFKIDNNFKPRHGEIRCIDSNIVYYRINNWKGDCFLNLVNNRKKMNARNLIIDLRGNGGGYGGEVLSVLSLFFDEPKVIGTVEYPWFKESMIVVPEQKIFRFKENLKVFILVDAGTACASEIFSIAMKMRKNTWIVGDASTMGAIASPALFRFPSGAMVRLHTSIRRYHFDPNIYKEGKGIDPDIWISRTHPRDTYPYEDKVLKETVAISKTFDK